MASAADIRQRKLQSIYNALDSHNFKQVLKLCEKKDVEKWPITKALKACALVQQNRHDAAMDLCREAQAVKPVDEPTLDALIYAYHMMGCHGEMTALVDSACKANPNNPSLLNQLFLCHVRSRDFAKAQQTATRLYKLESGSGNVGGGAGGAGGGRYILWAATAMLIQARRGTAAPAVLLLAERMVAKALETRRQHGGAPGGGGGDPTGEELSLYVTLLEEQGKLREALAAVEAACSADDSSATAAADGIAAVSLENGSGNSRKTASSSAANSANGSETDGVAGGVGGNGAGESPAALAAVAGSALWRDSSSAGDPSAEGGTVVRLRQSERRELEAELLLKLGRRRDALAVVEWLLEHSPDQWGHYTRCFDLTLGGGVGGGEERSGEDEDAAAVPSAEAFCKLQAKVLTYQAAHPGWRSPQLAELELLRRFISAVGADASLPEAWVAREASSVLAAAAEAPADATSGVSSEGGTAAEALKGLPARGAVAEMVRLIVAYFGVFGGKLCCFHDLAPYLAAFTSAAAAAAGGSGIGDKVAETASVAEAKVGNGHACTNGSGAGPKAAAATAVAAQALRVFLRRTAAEMSFCASGAEAAEAASEASDREKAVKRLHRHIRARQMLRYLGAPEAVAAVAAAAADATGTAAMAEETETQAALAAAAALVAEYCTTLRLNDGAEGGQREVQHGDELVLLAVHTLRDVYRRGPWRVGSSSSSSGGGDGGGGNGGGDGTATDGYLLRVEAAALLEYAMGRSPYNFQFKVLAMELYQELGAFERGLLLDNGLEVKQIQLDTLSWLVLPGCMRCGYFVEAHSRCRGILALHRSCGRDTAEFIGRSFKQGNYSKATEMATFQEKRMDASLQLALAKVEVAALELTQGMHTAGVATAYLKECAMGVLPEAFSPPDGGLSALSDNLDRGIAVTWDSPAVTAAVTATGTARPAPRQKLEAHLAGRLLVQKLLLAALVPGGGPTGDSSVSKLRQRLEENLEAACCGSEVASRALAPAADADAAGEAGAAAAAGHVRAATEFEARALGWRVFLEAVSALGQARRALSPLGEVADTAAAGSAAEHLRSAAEGATALQGYFGGQELPVRVCVVSAAASGGGGGGGGAGGQLATEDLPLHPKWLAAACKWLVDTGYGSCLVLQALWQVLPPPKKKSKAKGAKGKKGGAGGGGSADASAAYPAELSEAQEALQALAAALLKLLATLSAVVAAGHKGDASRRAAGLCALVRGSGGSGSSSGSGSGSGAARRPAFDLWEEGGEGGGAAALQRAADLIARGQQTSCKRLHDVLREKTGVLQALPGLR